MASTAFKFNRVGFRIAMLPAVALLVLVSIQGLDRHFDSRVKKALRTRETGDAVALKATELLLLESQYLAQAAPKFLATIESRQVEIKDLVSGARSGGTSADMAALLARIETNLEQREQLFVKARQVVDRLAGTKSELTLRFRESDRMAEALAAAIDAEAARLIIRGEYLSDVRTAFRNALREYTGFTAAAMLNTNDLITFSDETRYLQSETDLEQRLKQVVRACDSTAAMTGDPADHQTWRDIDRLREKIAVLRADLYRLWKSRQSLSASLEQAASALQNSARAVSERASGEIAGLERNRAWSESLLIGTLTAVLILFSTQLIRSIVNPLSAISNAIDLFSKGRLEELPLPQTRRSDEIGQLAESFERMIETHRNIVQMARTLAEGNYRIDIRPRSEADVLGNALIAMTRSLRDFSRQVERRSEELEQLVAVRTQELQNMVRQLEENVNTRKAAERALRTVVDSSVDAIITMTPDRTITSVNPAFTTLFGYTAAEVIHRSVKLLHPSEQSYEEFGRKALADIHRNGQWRGEWVLRKKNGSPIPVEIGIAPLGLDSGKTGNGGYVSITRDITERNETEREKNSLEAQLRQVQKMEAIGTLAGGIAHDFNNILTSIVGYTEIALYDELAPDSPARFSLEQVLKAGSRAKSLVKQILAFSRQTEYEKMPVLVTPVIKEALKLLRASIPSTIEIVSRVDANTGTILADSTRIHQILMNLCSNSAYAMRQTGGILTVALSEIDFDPAAEPRTGNLKAGRYLQLSVSDTGAGMAPQILERVFDPFFSTKPKEEGTGLGLPVVHGIVKEHDGEILIDSQPGTGTTVTVLFPVIPSKKAGETTAAVEIRGGNERIMVVDDEESVVRYLSKMLKKLGYRVSEVTRSTEALERFKQQPDAFDLIITDQTMPVMTGDELARNIIAIRSDIPIILCTGFSYQINEERARELGVRQLLYKPIVRAEMTEAIRKALGQSVQG